MPLTIGQVSFVFFAGERLVRFFVRFTSPLAFFATYCASDASNPVFAPRFACAVAGVAVAAAGFAFVAAGFAFVAAGLAFVAAGFAFVVAGFAFVAARFAFVAAGCFAGVFAAFFRRGAAILRA